MLGAIVDGAALWKICLIALGGGVGVTAVFGFGIRRVEAVARARRDGDGAALVLNGVLTAVCAAICIGALVIGFIAMTHK